MEDGIRQRVWRNCTCPAAAAASNRELTAGESRAYDAVFRFIRGCYAHRLVRRPRSQAQPGNSLSSRLRLVISSSHFMLAHRSLASIFGITLAAAAILLAGCPKSPEPAANPAPAHPATVRLVVVDDPAMAKQIVRIERGMESPLGAELEVCEMTLSELTAAKSLAADAAIYPSDELGSLAERGLIRPLPAAWLEHNEFHRSDYFEPGGLAESQWGQEVYAVPFGSPVFVLYYRRDLFEKARPRTAANLGRLSTARRVFQ